jgi:hypothetical protein
MLLYGSQTKREPTSGGLPSRATGADYTIISDNGYKLKSQTKTKLIGKHILTL